MLPNAGLFREQKLRKSECIREERGWFQRPFEMFGSIHAFVRKHAFQFQLCLRFGEISFLPSTMAFLTRCVCPLHINVRASNPPAISQKHLPCLTRLLRHNISCLSLETASPTGRYHPEEFRAMIRELWYSVRKSAWTDTRLLLQAVPCSVAFPLTHLSSKLASRHQGVIFPLRSSFVSRSTYRFRTFCQSYR